MSENPIFSYEEDSRRKGRGVVLWLLLIAFIGGAGGAVYWVQGLGKGPAPKKQETVMIRPLPPPAPVKTPPPPKAEPEKIKQEMMEQSPVADDEEKPEAEAAPDPGLSTGLTGTGGPDYGLSKAGNGNRIGGGGKKGGSRFGWYAAQVQKRISEAIQQNPIARLGEGTVQVRIWPDPSGRVKKIRLVGTTGNQKLDTAHSQEVISELVVTEPPPPDLPLPITLRISLKRAQ